MKTKSYISIFRSASIFGVIFMLCASGISSANARETVSASQSRIVVDYLISNVVLLPQEAKDAVTSALADWPYASPSDGRFSVLSLRWEEDWALATVTSVDLKSLSAPNQEPSTRSESLVPLLIVFDKNEWKAALKGDAEIKPLLELIPEGELSQDAKNAIFELGDIRSQAYTNYKFPWAPGNPWIVRGVWHGSGNRALDFRPSNNVNTDVLASAPGYVTALAECSPSDHYIMNITTENTGEYLGYTHLNGASVRAEGIKLGDYIPQGKELGLMAGAFSGSDSCNISSTGMHLHILLATKPFTIDGKTFSDSYIYDGVDLYSTQAGSQTLFADVAESYWAWSYIKSLYDAGITGGCGSLPLVYCPENTVTRSQMAVFLLRGEHGSTYVPPVAGGNIFTDVSAAYWAANWIEQLASEGITGGCGTQAYCPDSPVSRTQMAIFLLRTKHGASYSPPPASGTFADVNAGYWAAAWIEQLAAEGVTSGCGSGNYCPDQGVTRAQMAVFLVKTFNLP